MSKKPVELKKDKFTLQVNYDDEAIEKKLMKFITPSGDEFTISAEEMSTILIGQVNAEVVEATFVESEHVNVVEVERQVSVRADRDIKEGEEIRLNYSHPYPVEFAIIEEAANIARIRQDVPVMTLTKEYIDSVKSKTTKEQNRFVEAFYKFFKNLSLKKKANGSP